MIVISTTSGNILSTYTRNLSPTKLRSNTIVKELLNGSVHVQTVGKAVKSIGLEIIATKQQAEAINDRQAKGELFTLRDKTGPQEKYYLKNQISWNMVLRGRVLYQGAAEFIKEK